MDFTEIENLRQTQLWTWLRGSYLRKVVRGKSCIGELWDWRRCPRLTLPNVKQLANSLTKLRAPALDAIMAENDREAPIFVLGTSWKTGSTLLQRMLVTDSRLLLWGEPFGDMAIVSRIAEMLNYMSTLARIDECYIQDDVTLTRMATSWIATLYPPAADFRLGIRNLFDRWLGDPARQRGFVRWGFKEVRLGATEATLLRWLYPHAKFVILSRHPYDCYRSLSDANWPTIYYRRPDVPIDSAASFARHWNRLATSWSELPMAFPFRHIRYEDLVHSRVDLRDLESWLGIEMTESVALAAFVGRTAIRRRLSWYERRIIAHEASAGMHALGYSD